MKTVESRPKQFSGDEQFIRKHGDEVWNDLCDRIFGDKWFKIKDVAQQLPSLETYAPNLRHRYLRAVLYNVWEDHKKLPDEPCAFEFRDPEHRAHFRWRQ
jgi:hypothetical protein